MWRGYALEERQRCTQRTAGAGPSPSPRLALRTEYKTAESESAAHEVATAAVRTKARTDHRTSNAPAAQGPAAGGEDGGHRVLASMRSTPAASSRTLGGSVDPTTYACACACVHTHAPRTCTGAHMRLCSCSCAHASMYARGRGGRAGRATCTMARTAWGSEMSAAHSSTHARLQRALSACVPLESHCAPYWHGIGTLSARSSPAGLGPLWHQSCTRRVRAALRRSALAGRRSRSS